MSGFLLGVALLLIVAAALLLLRRNSGPRAADEGNANLGWYSLRRQELGESADADEALLDDAKLRLIEDGVVDAAPERLAASGRRFPVLALLLVLACGAAAVYLRTGAIEDVLIYRELASIKPEDGEARREALLRRIEARSQARPGNLQYLSLLGQLYMAAEDFPAASDVFGRLATAAPEDPQALAMAAQARFLASDRAFDETAQLFAERALAVDPTQRTALGLLGMASFESGAFATAINYWERLRDLEPTGSPGYQMLDEVIGVARERGNLPLATTNMPTDENVANGPGIFVELSLPDDAAIDPAATVFVFARSAQQDGGMPVAVRRLQAADLPLTLRLVDADAMAGQRLSEAGEVLVSAQVSVNGQPGVANAAYAGIAGPVAAGDATTRVAIELQPASNGRAAQG